VVRGRPTDADVSAPCCSHGRAEERASCRRSYCRSHGPADGPLWCPRPEPFRLMFRRPRRRPTSVPRAVPTAVSTCAHRATAPTAVPMFPPTVHSGARNPSRFDCCSDDRADVRRQCPVPLRWPCRLARIVSLLRPP
jgi:hypothetical protein